MELAAEVVRLSELAPSADRCLPVDEQLADLFPSGGLVRGQILGVTGPAAHSLVAMMAARAVVSGSWVAVVGVPSFGVESAIELGVPASRLVAVDAGTSSLDWSERVAATVDGFDIVITQPPRRADHAIKRIRQRLRARGAVLLTLEHEGLGNEARFSTSDPRWIGIGNGHGALLARSVEVAAHWRRRPHPIKKQLWLPDAYRDRLVC